MKLAGALCAALLITVLPTAAYAAPPVTIGQGVEPTVTVDPSGTAYIAWIGSEPTTTTLHFCRLPRGRTACSAGGTVAVPGTSLTRPYVTVHQQTVRLFTYRYGLT